MKNRNLVTGIVIAVILLIGTVVVVMKKDNNGGSIKSSTGTTTDQSVSDTAPANEVYIKNFAYAPARMTIKKGTKITWTNKDDAHHDITPDKDSAKAIETSKLLAKGESYSYTFTEAGVYSYHCSPHPYMKATIEVTE